MRPEKADEAARLFEQGGFRPIYVDHRDDGDISFWFGKASGEELYRLFNSIPREFYAIQGVVVGDSYPFAPGKRERPLTTQFQPYPRIILS